MSTKKGPATPRGAQSPLTGALPSTPSWMAPLSRELEHVISQRNMLTCRTKRRVLEDLSATAAAGEDATMETLRARAVAEVLQSERSYLRHLEIVREYFMMPLKVGYTVDLLTATYSLLHRFNPLNQRIINRKLG